MEHTMWAILIPLIEKLAVSFAPSVLSWIGDEALSVITGRVNAENTARTAQAQSAAALKTETAIAQAEAAAPKTDDAVDARLKEHSI
jgi:hypothetical protein